ncbi:MAG: YqgE/AlgH family protein [Betaproteobacteria bacterium]|nr:YqgE/AlgH family protein [Betaproteobacteria bacterium]
MLRLSLWVVLLLCGAHAAAQGPNGIFLIAKPDLTDSNFRQTVVLVTQGQDHSTVGVIINRPSTLKLAEILGNDVETGRYRHPVFLGGPVIGQTLVAVFQSDTPPPAPAFHVLRTLYMSMHPENVRHLLASAGRRYRLYAGFSGWAPRQLESEFDREGWFVLPVDEEMVFRDDTSGLWEELVNRAQALRTRFDSDSYRR